MVAQIHIDTYIHLRKDVIKIIRVANPGPLEHPERSQNAKIVNNYQLLTGATRTFIPRVTGHGDALLNLTVIKKIIFNWKFARSRFVGGKFCKVCKGSFQESNF